MPGSPPVVMGSPTARQVAFVGPLGVGKTTAVRSLSDVKVVSTDVPRSLLAVSSASMGGKTTTTVGIDYGEWTAPDGRRIALLGTPGQVRFSSARRSVMGATTRIVLWLYGDTTDSLAQAREWIRLIGDPGVWDRLVLAVTRRDTLHGHFLWDYEDVAREFHPRIPVLDADPRERDDVARVVLTALELS